MPEYAESPFNAGFGVQPPVLAGREEVLHQVLLGLGRGPGRAEFHTLLLGARGTGKTVLLHAVEDHLAAEKRSVFLRWDASEPVDDAVRGQQPALDAQLRRVGRRGLRRIEPELVIKAAPGGVGAEATLRGRTTAAAPSTGVLLEKLAEAAAARDRTVVMLVDELHAASDHDLRVIANAVQQLANVRSLPLALVAAGVPHTVEVFQRANVTFMERWRPTVIGNLDPHDTRAALEIPFLDAGRDITAAALDHLVEATTGYPYAVQLAGNACWEAAGDSAQITIRHARQAAAKTRSELTRTVFVSTWQRLRPADQQYAYAVAKTRDHGGVATTGAAAGYLGRSPQSVARSRDRLINTHAVLRASQHGRLEFVLPGFGDWVAAAGDRLRAEHAAARRDPHRGTPRER
jgi:AAA ATPase domain